jgi:hypothetical protein
VASA